MGVGTTTIRSVSLGVLLLATACAALGLGGAKRRNLASPGISVSAVRLVQLPSDKALASYYCGEYLGPIVCRTFGPTVTISDVHFAFDVELELHNPNPIPLPVVQSPFAFTAFPQERDARNLGTACLSFCEDPRRCRQSADACISDQPEIRDAKDFAGAVKGFLVSVALEEKRFSELRVKTIPPGDRTKMVVRLGLDPTKMVDLIAEMAKADIARVKRAQTPRFTIPYRIEGTAWVNVESFGRLATDFGPTTGHWQLRR